MTTLYGGAQYQGGGGFDTPAPGTRDPNVMHNYMTTRAMQGHADGLSYLGGQAWALGGASAVNGMMQAISNPNAQMNAYMYGSPTGKVVDSGRGSYGGGGGYYNQPYTDNSKHIQVAIPDLFKPSALPSAAPMSFGSMAPIQPGVVPRPVSPAAPMPMTPAGVIAMGAGNTPMQASIPNVSRQAAPPVNLIPLQAKLDHALPPVSPSPEGLMPQRRPDLPPIAPRLAPPIVMPAPQLAPPPSPNLALTARPPFPPFREKAPPVASNRFTFYQGPESKVLKRRFSMKDKEDQRLFDLGYPVSGRGNPVIDSPDFPSKMLASLDADSRDLDASHARPELLIDWGASNDLTRGGATRPAASVPSDQNSDLFGANEPESQGWLNPNYSPNLKPLSPKEDNNWDLFNPQTIPQEVTQGLPAPRQTDRPSAQPATNGMPARPKPYESPNFGDLADAGLVPPVQYYRPSMPQNGSFMARLGRGLRSAGEALNPNIASANMARAKAQADVQMKMLEMDAQGQRNYADNRRALAQTLMQEGGQDRRFGYGQNVELYKAELAAASQGRLTQSQGYEMLGNALAIMPQNQADLAQKAQMLAGASRVLGRDFTGMIGQVSSQGSNAALKQAMELKNSAMELVSKKNSLDMLPVDNDLKRLQQQTAQAGVDNIPLDRLAKRTQISNSQADLELKRDPELRAAKKAEALAKAQDVQRRGAEDQFASIQKKAQMGSTMIAQANQVLANPLQQLSIPNEQKIQAQKLMQQGQQLQQVAYTDYLRTTVRPQVANQPLTDMSIVETYKQIVGGDTKKAREMAKADGWVLPQVASPSKVVIKGNMQATPYGIDQGVSSTAAFQRGPNGELIPLGSVHGTNRGGAAYRDDVIPTRSQKIGMR